MPKFAIWGPIWGNIWGPIWAPGTDPVLMSAIQNQLARELNGAVQYLDPAFVAPGTPSELDSAIRIVSDRAEDGAITFVPATMRAYYVANLSP